MLNNTVTLKLYINAKPALRGLRRVMILFDKILGKQKKYNSSKRKLGVGGKRF